eukprot:PhM_4_TR10455/c0_g1_i1/m.65634
MSFRSVASYDSISKQVLQAGEAHENYLKGEARAADVKASTDAVDAMFRKSSVHDERVGRLHHQWEDIVKPTIIATLDGPTTTITTSSNNHNNNTDGDSATDNMVEVEVYDESAASEKHKADLRALAVELQELHDVQHMVMGMTAQQGNELQDVQSNVVSSDTKVQEGVDATVAASKYHKMTAGRIGTIALGTILGAFVAGPVGVVAGIQSTAGVLLCAGGGALAGGSTVNFVQNEAYEKNVEASAKTGRVAHLKDSHSSSSTSGSFVHSS